MQSLSSDHRARIERLSRREAKQQAGAGYSYFVRVMRLLLPLAAVLICAILFIVYGMESQDAIVPVVKKPHDAAERIVKNELLNPKFESRDRKDQYYQITAARAVQGEKNKELIMLDHPVGTLILNDGMKVLMRSDTGAYRQDTERFFLEGSVQVEHGRGYTLTSEEAHMDLKRSLAWSEKPVSGTGPDMRIEAQGMRADTKKGQVSFVGPATLVLEKGFDGVP